MGDLRYNVKAAWNGAGPAGEGTLTIGDEVLPYSVPADMGGKGKGASPETLLISAVTACYSATLYHFLSKRRLPVSSVAVDTAGFVGNYSLQRGAYGSGGGRTMHGGGTEAGGGR